jgi:hypothetical protein
MHTALKSGETALARVQESQKRHAAFYVKVMKRLAKNKSFIQQVSFHITQKVRNINHPMLLLPIGNIKINSSSGFQHFWKEEGVFYRNVKYPGVIHRITKNKGHYFGFRSWLRGNLLGKMAAAPFLFGIRMHLA